MSTLREHVRRRLSLLDVHIDTLSWESTIGRIRKWAEHRESRYICLCNVHSLVTGYRSPELRQAIERADTAAPDGMPVAWLMRRRGVLGQERIDGPGLMWRYAEQAALDGTPIFLFGATQATLDRLIQNLRYHFPALHIAGYDSPPFRALTPAEEDAVVEKITRSGAAVVFVGLGCPRQELWMADIAWRIPAVLIGVGAAFDFHAGVVKRAPAWMQRNGLEWFYRFCSEPRRLWRRYLVTNSLFVYYLIRDRLRKQAPPQATQ